MEDKDKEIEIPQIKFKRKVSIFKRRKKSEIRPFVRETNQKKFTKIIIKLLLIFCALFSLAAILYGIRSFVLPYFFEFKNSSILSPVEKSIQTADIEHEIRDSGLDIENIKFSKDLSLVTFTIHRETEVRIDPKKGIKSDIELLKKIESQMSEENKRAIYIDLRYNKPIVKF